MVKNYQKNKIKFKEKKEKGEYRVAHTSVSDGKG
jgi:hypothetical protein